MPVEHGLRQQESRDGAQLGKGEVQESVGLVDENEADGQEADDHSVDETQNKGARSHGSSCQRLRGVAPSSSAGPGARQGLSLIHI